jgi:hypothetical protein
MGTVIFLARENEILWERIEKENFTYERVNPQAR